MAKNKTTKVTRKVPKRYEFVEFEHDLFDGVFRLPRFTQISLKNAAKMTADPSAVLDFLEEAGVDADTIEAVSSLSPEELESFFDAWTDGVVIHPKSVNS